MSSEVPLPRVTGIVWQLYEGAPKPDADYHRLGVQDVLIQWVAVDGIAFVPGTDMREAENMPNWEEIRGEPWARNFIVGLSGRFDENASREELDEIARESERLAGLKFPFRVSGYYFPAEADPSWQNTSALSSVLKRLPRPLWISVYDSNNIGAEAFADWTESWLPADVGIFFQDGVGVWARTPSVAREYADALSGRLGKDRVRVIVEAFRPSFGRGFRPATAEELRPQLQAMRGYQIFLFDGAHYVDDQLIDELKAADGREE